MKHVKISLLLLLFGLTACSGTENEPETKDSTIDTSVETDTEAPIITEVTQTSIQMNPGEVFHPNNYITAVDDSSVLYYDSNYEEVVDFNTPGNYTVTITVTDEVGNTSTVDVVVTTLSNTAPFLEVKELYAVYNQFDIQDIVVSVSDDSTPKESLIYSSNYNDVVPSGSGDAYVTITVTDTAGLSTSKQVHIYKANDAVKQLYNYAYVNTEEMYRPYYGDDSTYINDQFLNGMLQLDVYEDGYIYLFYTDETSEDFRLQFHFQYGDLFSTDIPVQFSENYNSLNGGEFKFAVDNTSQFTENMLTVDLDFSSPNSYYPSAGDKTNVELRAEAKLHEFLVVLQDFFSNEIHIPLN